MFEIRPTAYGGRGCFATCEIARGTRVHCATTPFTAVIFRDFRKEVCGYCFAYDLGRAWKVRLGGTETAGLWFCSEGCRERWVNEEDHTGELVPVLELIEQTVALARRKLQSSKAGEYDEDFVTEDFSFEDDAIDKLWEQVDGLLTSNSVTANPLRNPILKNRILALEDIEYDSARLIAVAIVRLFLETYTSSTPPWFTWSGFAGLESHEKDLINRLPALLESHIRVYIFLKAVMPKKFQAFVTSANVRAVLGRESANAFGIWQLPLTTESECLGSSIFPSASYFNHSCDPNVIKTRTGRQMHFTTSRFVKKGEELCISYGMMLTMAAKARQDLLQEQWYFKCGCGRCTIELATAA
ncbi:hypothetical protein V1517DRAFT_324515 [Lipomyces orientalis]|uniref:Uncharacterized protein n=1 Tax=Lipomyces orientalis TaxID=1233043 RepID=A0ACC3TMG4_9ASCO